MNVRYGWTLLAVLVAGWLAATILPRSALAETFNHDVGNKRVVKEATVAAPVAAVWRAWTDPAIISEFFAPRASVELRVGGAYEMLFLLDAPEGQRGCEGCTVLSYVPEQMLSFSWSAPPKFAQTRPLHTWVVLQFEPVSEASARVRLTHVGFGRGDEWDAVHAYFERAWGSVMQNLVAHFAQRDLAKTAGPGRS
jgi:uncharacterized protein YndB with AHSA1/START domain